MTPTKPALRAAAFATVCGAIAIAACDLVQSGTQPSDSGVPPIDASGDVTVDASDEAPVVDAALDVDGAPPPFSPASISGLEIWLKADQGLIVDAGGVTGWIDQSGKGDPARNATPSGFNPPTVVDSGVGPSPFFGPAQGLRTGKWDAGLSDPTTAFVVASRASNLALPPAYLFDSVAAPEHSTAILTDSYLWQFAGNIGARAAAVSPMAVISVFNGPSSFILCNRNKGDAGTASPGGFKPGPGFTIGNYQGGGYPFGGTIAEFAVYSRVLTDNEIASLNMYASQRYGIVIQ